MTDALDHKLAFICQLFQKASAKPIELYALTRLWHRLNDPSIKMVPQQYVRRDSERYALTDVYFPQFKLHVEINEPAHYCDPARVAADKARKQEIESQTGHEVREIKCCGQLSSVHDQIDTVVSEIKQRQNELQFNGRFQPWDPDQEFDPHYWREKAILRVEDEICLRTVDDICILFGADPKSIKRGFLKKGIIAYPRDPTIDIWWPADKPRSGWNNVLNSEGTQILETCKNAARNQAHFEKFSKSTFQRYVFFHSKDVLGFSGYRFVGIFENGVEKSKDGIDEIVWTRIGTQVSLR